ncbi:MAG: TonB-dependent receptor plug domain-containing protein, partial [Bacteroidota bacterium]
MSRFYWVFGFLLVFGIHTRISAQIEERLSVTYKNQSLNAVLQDLEARMPGLSFNYDPALVRGISITHRFERTSVDGILDFLLHPHALLWKRADNYILISRGKAPQRTFRLYGKVLSAETGEHLSGIYVRSNDPEQKYRAESDVLGEFMLKIPVNASVPSLIIGAEGYKTQVFHLQDHDTDESLQILMQVRQSNISPVVIEEGVDQTVKVADQASEMSLKPERVAHLSSLGGPDVMRSIQLLPGVQGDQEGAVGLQVRGGSADQTLVMLDGITIYEPGHFYGMISLFNSRAIDKVKLIRGGFGAAYGGRTSAVIDMEGRPKRIDSIRASAGVNLLQASAHVEVPVLTKYKGSLLLAGRRTFTDVWASPTFSNIFDQYFQKGVIHEDRKAPAPDGGIRTMRPRFHFGDLNAKFTLKPGQSDLLTVSMLASRDRLQYRDSLRFSNGGGESSHDEIIQQNLGLSANWTRVWNS